MSKLGLLAVSFGLFLVLVMAPVVSSVGYPVKDASSVGNGPMAFVAELQQSGTSKDLYSIQFTDVFKGFVGGLNETLLKTSNSGTTWMIDRTGGSGFYTDIDFKDSRNGTIAGTACWGPDPDPNYSGDNHVIGYQQGGKIYLSRDWSAVLRTTDGGATWKKTFTPTNFIVSSAHFLTDKLGMITTYGSPTHTDSDIWYTSDGGKTWGRYADWQYFMDSAMYDLNNWWVVGDVIVKTSDGGANWAQKSVSNHMNAVVFIDTQNGWAAGDGGAIVNTIDGGQTWTKQTSGVTTSLYGISFVSANEGWAVGAGGKIVQTMDGGKTWASLQGPTSVDLNDVYFPDPNFGWAVGDSGKIVFIHDGSPPPPPKGKLSTVQIDPSTVTMNVNETRRFNATGYDTSGTPIPGLSFTWSLSHQLGTITQLGQSEIQFKATGAGTTTLSADTSYNGTSGKGTSSITINSPPPPPPPNKAPLVPIATGPASGLVGQAMSYDITGTDPDNDQVKYLVDWGDGTNQTTSMGASGWTASVTHSWSAAGSYNVKAKGIDAKSAESAWSSPIAVSITKPSGGGSPPSTPTINGPAQGVPATEYSYTLTATDPDSNKIMFTIDWGDSKTDTTPYIASGAATTIKHTWASGGNYTVKAKAKDDTGLESAWASTLVHIATDVKDQPPEITHVPVTQGIEGTQITVQATITDDISVDSATLYYKSQGATTWSSVSMQGSGQQYSGVIPASKVVKGTLQYYLQAKDSGGNVVESPASGASDPYAVVIRAKGGGGGSSTQPPGGSDQTLMTLAIIAVVIIAVAVVSLLLIWRRGRKGQAMSYPPYYAQQYQQYDQYPQQYDGNSMQYGY